MAENLRTLEYHIPESFHGHTVEAFLRSKGYSKSVLYHLRNTEGLFRNGQHSGLKEPLMVGDTLVCRILETDDSPNVIETEIPLSIVYEDEDILVIDKPAGLPIHPSMGHYEHTLGNALCWYTHHILGYDHYVNRIVNRLDKNTSGLLIAAKNMLAAARLGDMIRAHEIEREYLAIASGDFRDLCMSSSKLFVDSMVPARSGDSFTSAIDAPSSNTADDTHETLPCESCGLYLSASADPAYARTHLQNLDGALPPLLKQVPTLLNAANPVLGLHFTVNAPIGRAADSVVERCIDYAHGDYAVTHGMLLSYNRDKDLSFLRLRLETGRTHQIRVHLLSIGHPLPGDFLYHADERFISRQPLHSWRLRFHHPISGRPLEFTAPLPEDMRRLL